MDFKFTAEEGFFRQELRELLKQELPEGASALDEGDEDWELTLKMRKKLAAKGWL